MRGEIDLKNRKIEELEAELKSRDIEMVNYKNIIKQLEEMNEHTRMERD